MEGPLLISIREVEDLRLSQSVALDHKVTLLLLLVTHIVNHVLQKLLDCDLACSLAATTAALTAAPFDSSLLPSLDRDELRVSVSIFIRILIKAVNATPRVAAWLIEGADPRGRIRIVAII